MTPDPTRRHVATSIAAAGAGALLAAHDARAEPRFVGLAPAYVGDLREEFVTGRKFGLTGDGSDQTAGLNAALSACWQSGKRLRLAAGLYGVNPSTATACVVSNGTSIEGEGNNRTIITPLGGVGPAHSILEITPPANGASEFLTLSDLLIYPGQSGTKRGKHSIHLRTPNRTNVGKLMMRNVYLHQGNDYSFASINDPAVNAQGNFANSVFDNCTFLDGFQAVGCGDSNVWRSCVFRNSSVARNIIDMTPIDAAGGAASIQYFEAPNIGGLGAIVLHAGRNYIILGANAELGNESGSTGSVNHALLDIMGDVGQVVGVSLIGRNVFSIFGDTMASDVIRVGNAVNVNIEQVELSSGARRSITDIGLNITAQAVNTYIGEITSQDTAAFSIGVRDNGIGTRGRPRLVTGLIANAIPASSVDGSFQPPTYTKSRLGSVSMAGAILIKVSPSSGKALFSLPVPYRPAFTHYALVRATVNGVEAAIPCSVNASGDFILGTYSNVSRVHLESIAPWHAAF
ncbi:hypothetical protein ABIE45_003462 [Methylobacterium sp. OAE515]|uniref:hypothetical protein n=1 Tax=Methylobacterium sp. OAE515 TaxID=2817895 RepID=UPI00178B795F